MYKRQDTTSDLILSQETDGQFDWGNGGKGLELLSYDPEQHLAALVYSRGTADLADSPPTHIRLNATYFIPGHRQAELALDREELPTETLELSLIHIFSLLSKVVEKAFHLKYAAGTLSVTSRHKKTRAGWPALFLAAYGCVISLPSRGTV